MWIELIQELGYATVQTVLMVFVSSIFGIVLGIPLGILLFFIQPGGIKTKPFLYKVIAFILDSIRSLPFIILLIAVIPITRFIVGTSIGTAAAIVPLTLGVIPFIARMAENVFNEISKDIIEAGLAMGANSLQIIRYILIPESKVALIRGMSVIYISLLSYSAMAGVVGGGGIGDLAIRYGYQRFDIPIMIGTIIILLILVQFLQGLNMFLIKKYSFSRKELYKYDKIVK